MHNLITDLRPKEIISSGRKSYTFQATIPDDPTFLIRRVIRSPHTPKNRALNSPSALPLSPTEYKQLLSGKAIETAALCSWLTQHPLSKFSILRSRSVYSLSAIDERNTDSYLLRTRDWNQVRVATYDLTSGCVDLPTPAVLDAYNPFGLYAPFNRPPSLVDFESINNELVQHIEASVEALSASGAAGFMQGKVVAEYYAVAAQLERLSAVLHSLSTPSPDHFENEDLEK